MFDVTLQVEETPMSADVLQRLNQDGVLTIETMADLFNIQKHSCYPYLLDREMRYGHIRTLCRRATDPRIPAAFYNDLQAGTGWSSIYIDADLDFDGDGDVDLDDVLGHAIEANEAHAAYLREAITTGTVDLAKLSVLKQRVLQGIVTSERAAAHIAASNNKRRRARPFREAVRA